MTCFNADVNFTEFEANSIPYYKAWGFGKAIGYSSFSEEDYTELSGAPTFTVPENFYGSSANITFTFDAVGFIETQNPAMFKDCYTFDDKVDKLTNRLTYLKATVTSANAKETVLINQRMDGHYFAVGNLLKDKNFDGFVQPNGYINVAILSEATDTPATVSGTVKLDLRFLHDPVEDADRRTFRYNGVKQPSWVRVQKVTYPMVAPVDNQFFSVNQGKRKYDMGQQYGERYIALSLVVVAGTQDDVRQRIFELADLFDTRKETEMKFSDEPEVTWFVKLDGEASITEELNSAKLSVSFLCMRAYGQGKENVQTFEVTETDNIVNMLNGSTAETFPRIKLTMHEDADFFDIVGAGDSANISLGRKVPEQVVVTPFDPQPQVGKWAFTASENWNRFSDDMFPQGMEKWQFTRTNGQLVANVGTASMKNWNYGTDGDWRGDGIYQNLPRALTDFRIELSPAILGGLHNDVSNFSDIVLYDQNAKPFARLQFGARHYANLIDCYLIANNGSSDEGLQNGGFSILSNKGNWNNFQGKVILERRANKWRITMGQYIDRRYSPAPESIFDFGEAMLKDIKSTPWFELPRSTWDKKLSRVGLIMKNFRVRKRVPHFTLRRLVIWEYKTPPVAQETKVISFKQNDEVVVDFDRAQVWLNGKIEPSLVHPSTDWFSFDKGWNTIGFNNLNATAEIVYYDQFK